MSESNSHIYNFPETKLAIIKTYPDGRQVTKYAEDWGVYDHDEAQQLAKDAAMKCVETETTFRGPLYEIDGEKLYTDDPESEAVKGHTSTWSAS
jgi:hypothetical protein